MLKKINYIFIHEGIFDFLYMHLNTIRAKSDGSGVKDKRV
jgi:hypothetical protein